MSENKIIGIVGLLIAAIYGYGIITVPAAGTTFLSGTKIFPIIIALGTAIFSAIILLQDFKKNAKIKKLVVDKKVMLTMGLYVLIFIVYTLIFEAAGFILSTVLMLTALLSILNKGKLKVNLIIGIAFPVIAYGIFAKLFAISLPTGIIYF